jgi:hypothetical protein
MSLVGKMGVIVVVLIGPRWQLYCQFNGTVEKIHITNKDRS